MAHLLGHRSVGRRGRGIFLLFQIRDAAMVADLLHGCVNDRAAGIAGRGSLDGLHGFLAVEAAVGEHGGHRAGHGGDGVQGGNQLLLVVGRRADALAHDQAAVDIDSELGSAGQQNSTARIRFRFS